MSVFKVGRYPNEPYRCEYCETDTGKDMPSDGFSLQICGRCGLKCHMRQCMAEHFKTACHDTACYGHLALDTDLVNI